MMNTPSEQPGIWSLQGIFAGTSGHAFVAMPYATPSAFDSPAGVALYELDAAGNVLGDLGPSDDAVSLTVRGLGVFGARHYVVGVSFAEWTTYRTERLASDNAYISSHRQILDSGKLLGATGDAAGDTFAMIGVGDNPNPSSVGWDMCWGAEWGNFLVKWGPEGAHAWTKPLAAYAACPTSFAADGEGGVYLSGGLPAQVDVGCATTSAGSSYVERLDTSGACVWGRGMDLGAGSLVMLAGGAGALYLSNTFQGTIDLGCGPMTSGSGTSAYVAQLGSGGLCVYSKSFAVDNLDVALFPTGDVLLTTTTAAPVSFGGAALAELGVEDFVVARLDPWGAYQWSRRFGAPGETMSCAGAYADAQGSVVLPCSYAGTVDFGGGPLAGGGVVKLDGAGTQAWQRAPAVGAVASDPCGAVLVASTCPTCAASGAPGVRVSKLSPKPAASCGTSSSPRHAPPRCTPRRRCSARIVTRIASRVRGLTAGAHSTSPPPGARGGDRATARGLRARRAFDTVS
jgi:hypothetical protein